MPHPASILPEPYRPPTREQIERARAMYGEGFTVARILAATDMALGTLYGWLDGGPAENGAPLLPPIPRRRAVAGKRRAPLAADRVSVAARLWRTAERQARDIEERLARPGAASPERERDVRMLALLVRTLRELSAFHSGAAPEAQTVEPALQAARQRLAGADALREAEERVAVFRQMASYLREIRKVEAQLTAREAAVTQAEDGKAQSAAEADEFRRALARRIEGFTAARQAAREQPSGEGGAG